MSDNHNIDTVMELQEKALSCHNFDDLRSQVLEPTTEYLDAATSCFLQFNDQSGVTGRSAAHNVAVQAHADYLSYFFRDDPYVAYVFDPSHSSAIGRYGPAEPLIFCSSEVRDETWLARTPFYNEFFRPNDIHHMLVMALYPSEPKGQTLILAYHRPASDQAFAEVEKRRLRKLAAALNCTLRMLSLQDSLMVHEEVLAEMDMAYPEHGLVFLDENMSLLYGNQTGLRDLELYPCAGRSQKTTDRIHKLARACHTASLRTHEAEGVVADFSEGEDLVAKVHARRDYSGQIRYAVHTNRRMAEAIFTTRCRDFDFTPRELDITRAVAAGLSNAQIAERLFISVRTVENHLRSIYSKAGVNRRTQLLCRLNESH